MSFVETHVDAQDGLSWVVWEFEGSNGTWYDARDWASLDELDHLRPLGASAGPAP